MRRRDVGIGFGIGIGILVFILVGGSGTSHPLGNFVEKSLFGFWFVGVALLAMAVVLHALRRWPMVERGIGVTGIAWVTFIVGYDVLLFLLVLYAVTLGGGIGY
jgi:hypothetical protein